MYVFETFLERVRSVNGTRSERKWGAFGTQMGRVRNANGARSECKWSAFGMQMSAFGTQMDANAVLGYF